MNKKTKMALFAIFIFAITIRIAAYFLLRRDVSPLFWEYHEIANNFLAGRGLCCNFLGITHYAYLEPFYPLFSALLYKLTGHNYLIFGMVNIFFSGILTLAVFSLAEDLFCEKTGLLSAFITAAHPGLIYYSTEFHPLTFDALFFVMIVAYLVRLSKTATAKDALLAGLWIGIAFLSRTNAIVFIPVAFFVVVFLLKVSAKAKMRLSLLVLLISLSAVTVWAVRNYVVLHEVIITRSSPGWLFWLGNNPHHTGSAMYTKDSAVVSTLSEDDRKSLLQMDELGQNKFFTDRAISFVRSDPGAFLVRWAKRIYYFWWFTPQAGFLYPPLWLLIYQTFYLFLLIPAVSAIFLISIYNKKLKDAYLTGVFLTIFCCLVLSFVQGAFYVEGRHRWVLEPIMGIFSAWSYVHLFGRLKHF